MFELLKREAYFISKKEFFDLTKEFINEDYYIETLKDKSGVMNLKMMGKTFIVFNEDSVNQILREVK